MTNALMIIADQILNLCHFVWNFLKSSVLSTAQKYSVELTETIIAKYLDLQCAWNVPM